MKKLPVILITGFLGAGKTTFLNEMLSHFNSQDQRTALLINEFGRINIDKELIDQKTQAIYEVNQGSIFCVCTRDQFISALDHIAGNEADFDVAVIESTGIANTGDLGKYLSTPPLVDRIEVKQNFCIIDAANFHKVFQTLPAVKSQVEEASMLIINKSDLVTEEYLSELKEKLSVLNPSCPIKVATYGKLDFSQLIDLTKPWAAKSKLTEAPPQDIATVTLVSDQILDLSKLRLFLASHSHDLLRAKGFLKTDIGSMFMEWVGDKMYTKPADTGCEESSRFVLIGYKLDDQLLKNEFRNCEQK